jgi:septation ring formation regulator EzrA
MVVMTRETWTDGRMDEFKASVNLRFDEVDRRFDEVDKRFEQVDRRFDEVDKRFEQVDKRFEQVDKRFEQVERRLDRMDADIRELRQIVERMNMRMTTGFIGLAGLIVSSQLFF